MTLLLNIDVPDVEAATTFYTAAFGLTIGRRFGTDFVELLPVRGQSWRCLRATRRMDGSRCWPIRSGTGSVCWRSARRGMTRCSHKQNRENNPMHSRNA